MFYDNDPVFTLAADASSKGVTSVGWYANDTPLRSGWGWGASALDKGVEMIHAKVGQGHLALFGPEDSVPVAAAWLLQDVLQRAVSQRGEPLIDAADRGPRRGAVAICLAAVPLL